MLWFLIKIGLMLLFISICLSSPLSANIIILVLMLLFAFKIEAIEGELKKSQQHPDQPSESKKEMQPSIDAAPEQQSMEDEIFKQRIKSKYEGRQPAAKVVSSKKKQELLYKDVTDNAPQQDDFISAWVREKVTTGNPMTKIGMLIFFIGMAFFIKYATDHHLLVLSIEVRHMMVAAAGLVLVFVGIYLSSSSKIYASILSGGGVGLMYLTVYSAFHIFHLIAPLPAFVMLISIVIVSGALAVTQNAKQLALFGVLGGFLAPILISTGSNDYVSLFSYYLVLNVAILGLALFKSWRELNYVGFVFTYVISGLWGYQSYRLENFSTVEPFLIIFFLFYVAIVILHALHRPNDMNKVGNIGLALANPVIAFGLQSGLVHHFSYGVAVSAITLCLFYGLLAASIDWCRSSALRHLHDAFIALCVLFGTMAVPFTFTMLWSETTWAFESIALLWIGIRQDNIKIRVASGIVMLSSLAIFINGLSVHVPDAVLFSQYYLSGIFIFIAFLINSYQLYQLQKSNDARDMSLLFFILGCVGWYYINCQQIYDVSLPENFIAHSLIFFATTSMAACLTGLWLNWRWLQAVAMLLLPAMLCCFVPDVLSWHDHNSLFYSSWAFSFAALYTIYYLQDDIDELSLPNFHLMAFIFLIAWIGNWVVTSLSHYYPMDHYLQVISAGLIPAVILLLVVDAGSIISWPFAKYEESYQRVGAGAIVCYLAVWFIATCTYAGGSPSLFSLPLLNPLDISIAVSFIAVLYWLRFNKLVTKDMLRVILLFGFIWINVMLLRSLHFWLNIDYSVTALWGSVTVQSALSLCWSITALMITTVAARIHSRGLWFAGFLLMAIVVCKLFMVDLSDSNTLERIITFVGVGVLMLINGYVSPLPPKE